MRGHEGRRKKYTLEESWLFTNKLEDSDKLPLEHSFIVESFEKQPSDCDSHLLTFMKPRRKSQKKTVAKSFLQNRPCQKKDRVMRLIDKTRKQSQKYIKRLLDVSADVKRKISVSAKRGKSQPKLSQISKKKPLVLHTVETPSKNSLMTMSIMPLTTHNKENAAMNDTMKMLARKQELEKQLKQINTSLLIKRKNRKVK